MWKHLESNENIGSEGGLIIFDEEYNDACRITLEKTSRYYAITCGIFGDMVYTAFCLEENNKEKYVAMKKELQEFIDKDLSNDVRYEFYDSFTEKY